MFVLLFTFTLRLTFAFEFTLRFAFVFALLPELTLVRALPRDPPPPPPPATSLRERRRRDEQERDGDRADRLHWRHWRLFHVRSPYFFLASARAALMSMKVIFWALAGGTNTKAASL